MASRFFAERRPMKTLRPHQKEALSSLKDGNILYGDPGSGKTLTALSYYVENHSPKPLYVITTPKKRNDLDWVKEANPLGIGTHEGLTFHGLMVVDSWNNIKRYQDVKDAFFIFDEQRLVGYGAWVKTFLKIAKNNKWILLSGTPGDVWMDFMPVFVANGFYKDKTDFTRHHVVWKPYSKFPQIDRYVGTSRLIRHRSEVVVHMPYPSHTEPHTEVLEVPYDVERYRIVTARHKDPDTMEPIRTTSEMFHKMRKVVYSDDSRIEKVKEVMEKHDKLIIFYNFNYELEKLRELGTLRAVGEWNGQKHEPIPSDEKWLYLVQYTAGSEGWNCVETNATLFYSLTYSYKAFAQAKGRINRLDTKFVDLYYYILLSQSPIDKAVMRALQQKRSFNNSMLHVHSYAKSM